MFSKIFFTILVISIFNEVCQSQRLTGCSRFSDTDGSSQQTNKLIFNVNSTSSPDLSYFSINDASKKVAYLLVDSCSRYSKIITIISSEELTKRKKQFDDEAKNNLEIDFQNLPNNCKNIDDIKKEVLDIQRPSQPSTTLCIDLSEPITKKGIKRSDTGEFFLLDDCEKNGGDLISFQNLTDTIKKISDDFKKNLLIDFKTESCQPLDKIAEKVFNELQKRYAGGTVASLKAEATKVNKDDGANVIYTKNNFYQVAECKDRFMFPLDRDEVNKLLNDIAGLEIKRFTDAGGILTTA